MLYFDSTNLLINLKLLLDMTFLKDGFFRNVSLGDTVRGTDVSQLVRDTSSDSYFEGLSGVQTWQSPYKNWVYESGITMNDAPFISGMTPPIVASGVYINGTFFASSVSGVPFYIDFENGRVIFSNSIPENSVVKAEYSYRMFRVDASNSYALSDVEYHAQTELKDNPFSNGNELYPSGGYNVGTMPAVFLELGEDDRQAYELGNRSAIVSRPVYCHVYTYSPIERDSAMDLIASRWRIQMPMVDFNYAPLPLSGVYATLSPDYIPYQTLLTNVKFNGLNVISKHYYIENARSRPIERLYRLHRGVVQLDVEIYNIAPTGRIPQNPYV